MQNKKFILNVSIGGTHNMYNMECYNIFWAAPHNSFYIFYMWIFLQVLSWDVEPLTTTITIVQQIYWVYM